MNGQLKNMLHIDTLLLLKIYVHINRVEVQSLWNCVYANHFVDQDNSTITVRHNLNLKYKKMMMGVGRKVDY